MLSLDLPAKIAFYGIVACWWLFVLTFWLRKNPPRSREAKHDFTSYFGLFLQAVGYVVVWYRPLRREHFSPMPSSPEGFGWPMAALTVGIAVASVSLVISAARYLGKQWGLAARIVEDHKLIEEGPYRFVRNPIYTGMFGLLLATGLAVSNWIPLLAAIVIFAMGTWIRIRSEENLLRQAFGSEFDEYVRRVPALIPGVY